MMGIELILRPLSYLPGPSDRKETGPSSAGSIFRRERHNRWVADGRVFAKERVFVDCRGIAAARRTL